MKEKINPVLTQEEWLSEMRKSGVVIYDWGYFCFDDAVDAVTKNDTEDDLPGGSTPSQYGIPEGAKDLQDLIEAKDMNFALGNIFKAVYRMGNCEHSDRLRDLRKIIWFAERELKREIREY